MSLLRQLSPRDRLMHKPFQQNYNFKIYKSTQKNGRKKIRHAKISSRKIQKDFTSKVQDTLALYVETVPQKATIGMINGVSSVLCARKRLITKKYPLLSQRIKRVGIQNMILNALLMLRVLPYGNGLRKEL